MSVIVVFAHPHHPALKVIPVLMLHRLKGSEHPICCESKLSEFSPQTRELKIAIFFPVFIELERDCVTYSSVTDCTRILLVVSVSDQSFEHPVNFVAAAANIIAAQAQPDIEQPEAQDEGAGFGAAVADGRIIFDDCMRSCVINVGVFHSSRIESRRVSSSASIGLWKCSSTDLYCVFGMLTVFWTSLAYKLSVFINVLTWSLTLHTSVL